MAIAETDRLDPVLAFAGDQTYFELNARLAEGQELRVSPLSTAIDLDDRRAEPQRNRDRRHAR